MTEALTQKECLERLVLFNERAERLMNSSYIEFVSTKGSKLSFSASREKPELKMKILQPELESRESFILNLRFFILKEERTSFRKLTKAYESLNTLKIYKDRFNDIRNKLNEFLGSKTFITHNDFNIPRRMVLNVFLYGKYAHASEKETSILKMWEKNYAIYGLVENEFNHILITLYDIIQHVKGLNYTVIQEYNVL